MKKNLGSSDNNIQNKLILSCLNGLMKRRVVMLIL